MIVYCSILRYRFYGESFSINYLHIVNEDLGYEIIFSYSLPRYRHKRFSIRNFEVQYNEYINKKKYGFRGCILQLSKECNIEVGNPFSTIRNSKRVNIILRELLTNINIEPFGIKIKNPRLVIKKILKSLIYRMILFLKFVLGEKETESWIEKNDIKVSSILMLMKKHLGFKNQDDIQKKFNITPSFTRIKLCWKTENELNDILRILGSVVLIFDKRKSSYRYCNGRFILDYMAVGGKMQYQPYYKQVAWGEEKTLIYYTLEKTIERWIKEKF